MHDCMAVIVPLLLRLFQHLLPNQSKESANVQKLILKLFHHMIEVSALVMRSLLLLTQISFSVCVCVCVLS